MAERLGLINRSVLLPKENQLKKLFVFVPTSYLDKVRDAMFAAGAGNIGNYSECSFGSEGIGTFMAGKGADPFLGEIGIRHKEPEVKVELVFPSILEKGIITAMKLAHPYEEVAYDLISLSNQYPGIGSGLIGYLPEPITEFAFLEKLKNQFCLKIIRHTRFSGKQIQKIALCGGSGSFLISKALESGADAFITSDIKYHDFFDANNQVLICDIGHFESEQFTINLLADILRQKFPTFAVLKPDTQTNPVYYYF